MASRRDKVQEGRKSRTTEIVLALIGALSAITIAYLQYHPDKEGGEERSQGNEVTPGPGGQDTNSKYDFESGVMGWRAHESPDIRGCSGVKVTAERPYSGKQSLEITLSVSATNPAKRKCEARVEIGNAEPEGEPVSLEGHTISARLYAPQGSYGPGDAPNGVQLLVKDANGRFLYSRWRKVVEDEWMELLLKVPKAAELREPADYSFDPAQIRILGVKFQVGKNSTAAYNGRIWLDHVDY